MEMEAAATSKSIRNLVVLKQPALKSWGLFDGIPESLVNILPPQSYQSKIFAFAQAAPFRMMPEQPVTAAFSSTQPALTRQTTITIEQPALITPSIHITTESHALEGTPLPLKPVIATADKQLSKDNADEENLSLPFQRISTRYFDKIPDSFQRWELFETKTTIEEAAKVIVKQTGDVAVTDQELPVVNVIASESCSPDISQEHVRWELFAEHLPKPFQRAHWQKTVSNGTKCWEIFG